MTDISKDARDSAISTAAREGLSWIDQALAGLATFPRGTRGSGSRFSYLLMCSQSPLEEPTQRTMWATVFAQAWRKGLLEKTGRWIKPQVARRLQPEYRVPDPDRPIIVYVDPATEAEFIRDQLQQVLKMMPKKTKRSQAIRAKIADAIERLAPFIDA